jgi:hypothetical protein
MQDTEHSGFSQFGPATKAAAFTQREPEISI